MKYFIIFTLAAFLLVMAYIDVLKYLMGRDYWEGLPTVAVVMVGEIIKGVYFNLSFWYKLTDRTIWGLGSLPLVVWCSWLAISISFHNMATWLAHGLAWQATVSLCS